MEVGYQEVGGVYDYLKRMEGGNSERDQQRHSPGKRGDRGIIILGKTWVCVILSKGTRVLTKPRWVNLIWVIARPGGMAWVRWSFCKKL